MNSQQREPIISIIPYLNALPLTWWLTRTPPPGVRFSTDLPSESCRKLAAGEVDAGIVSSVMVPETPDIAIVDGVCIASEGPVDSVLLFSDRPLNQVRTIALDPASRTSNVLIQILMARWVEQPCQFVTVSGQDIEQNLQQVDAVLAIGDRAFRYGITHPSRVLMDLATEWRHFTGLPFVFAVWGVRKESPVRAEIFRHARDEGMAHLTDVIRHATSQADFDSLGQDMVRKYLTTHLHYTLGSRERKSLFLFYKFAHELGLLPPLREILFI